jgi:uncharacterized protein (TIGR03118 family)
LPAAGWVQTNHSTTIGTTNWFQGNTAVFTAQAGTPASYIGANFNNTTGTNTISNWLLTPPLTLQPGATMTFWTRTTTANPFPDRLQVRMSTNGASSNVGTTATDVGDFTTLLLDINPTYTVGGYPEVWTQMTVTVFLPPGPPSVTGRLAFRYFVENGGPTGANSNYIGIDTFQYNGPCGGATPTPSPTATATPSVSPTIPPITPTPTPTPTASASPTASPSASPTATVPGTPTPTPTASATPNPAAQAVNLSTRMRVQTGDKVGIGGFIITGTTAKQVLLRAIGPSLTRYGITDALADPVLELHGPGAFVTIVNNNWRDTQQAAIQATGLAPTNDFESAILATLPPGAYTAIVKGTGNTSGVALVEFYDLSPGANSKLGNLSTRAFVSTADNIVIAGFILGNGSGMDQIIVRGIGPSLAPGSFPASAVLADPTLELRDHNGTLILANNDWQDNAAQAADITAAGLAPSNNLESAVAATLPPGLYTALLAGLNNGTGIGLVEVYDRGGAPPHVQTNLVSDVPGLASHTDANLANPWGIATSPTSPFWVSDNHTGVSTLYNTSGTPQSLVVTVPPAAGGKQGSPTGIVFNGSTDFQVSAGAPARFIFATEDGTISGWASGSSAVLKVDNSASGAVYKGLAIGNNGTANFLYAADFHGAKIDVFDAAFAPATLAGTFRDLSVPAGYAPFNIQNIGGVLYVTYALQDADAHDDVPGLGHGYINKFDLNGTFIARFASRGSLNSPWGLAVAPAGFGAFANALLVGNFGDGRINAFNPATGAFLGQLADDSGHAISIEGLWGLKIGNGGNGGDLNTLYFAAGIAGPDALEDHGLFGSIAPQ